MSYIRYSVLLGEPADRIYDEWRSRRLSFQALREALDACAEDNPDTTHRSCWYIYDDIGGSLAVWNRNDQASMPFISWQEAQRVVDNQDWAALPNYDACVNELCQAAARKALHDAVSDDWDA